MQKDSTKFAEYDTIKETIPHNELVRIAVSEILSLSEKQVQEVARRYYAILSVHNS